MTAGGGVNANFYMFVPVPAPTALTVALSNSLPMLSFSTQTNFTYWVVYKNNLGDGQWKLLAAIPGSGASQTVADLPNATTRFYAVVVP